MLRFRMPEANGAADMSKGLGIMEGQTGDTFLFTSESVGEGHPGKKYCLNNDVSFRYKCCQHFKTCLVKQYISTY